MRILYVTQVMLDEPSGASRHVLSCVRELVALGHDVTLAAPGAATGGATRRVRPPRSLRPGLKMELALAGLCAKETLFRRPDVAYVRISASSSAVPSALSTLRIPIALELNGPVLDEMRRLGRSPAIVETARLALKQTIAMGHVLVVPQVSFGEHARDQMGARWVEHIPNGADLERAIPGDRSEAKQALGLPVEQRIAAHVGNLAPELRLDLLAHAHRKIPGLALLFVGDGAQRSVIEAMAMTTRPSSPVLFMGRRPHEEALQAIRAADVCIDARDGNLGSKSLEYAAMGRRQVAFDVEGVDRLTDLYPGLDAVHLVSERSPEALRSAIEAALEAERKHGPLPPQAVERARQQLGWNRTAAQLADLLDKLVDR